MFIRVARVLSLALMAVIVTAVGCQEKKTSKVTIEGPEKKTELKIERTEKK